MNPLMVGFLAMIVFAGYGEYKHRVGWDEGRQNLVQQQAEQVRAKLAKQTTRQQANDSKAADADDKGKAESGVIYRDVIRYVKTTGRNEPQFSDERVRIKSAAAGNAACIPEFDDCSVQAGASK